MADAKRQLAIAPDATAYDNIGAGVLAAAYRTAFDDLGGTTSAFYPLRVTQFSDNANRDVIIEESIDQVAASEVFGGTYSANGTFELALRPTSFASSGLLLGILGYQSPTLGNYKMSQIPATLALKIVDEQATTDAGLKGTTTIYRGVGITSFEMNLNVKEYARCTINWIGRYAEVYDSPYNTTEVSIPDDPAIFYNAVLTFGGDTLYCKGVTINLSRTLDQDYFYIGSEFLQGLYYNGLTDLGGTITLGAGDWERIRTMLAGSASDAMLDVGKTEFAGTLANAIPSGSLVITLRTPDGTAQAGSITIDTCKLTEMARSVQGRNQFEKTVNWKGVLNPPGEDFTFHVGV